MSRILAQLVVAGATVFMRAATQAWQQALINAQKSGVAQEAVKTSSRVIGGITPEEARMILQVEPGAAWPEVVKRFKYLFEQNEKQGSFYLQSKVYRAKEKLEEVYKEEGLYQDESGQDSSADSGPQKQIKQ